MKNTIIKSSKHYLNESNVGKIYSLNKFYNECQRLLPICIDYIWNQSFEWKTKTGQIKISYPCQGYYDIPKFISTKHISIKTDLSARMLSCLVSQSLAIIKSSVRKYDKLLHVIKLLENKDFKTKSEILKLNKLKIKALTYKPNKPQIKKEIDIEISSLCISIIRNVGLFDFIEICNLGKKYPKIILPIKHHKHSRKMENLGNLKKSVLLNKKFVHLRWDIEVPQKKDKGIIVGGDTGLNTILTLSNNITTDLIKDVHGHTLNSIVDSMSKKKKGSKSFYKAQKHRTNFINWSIKQLNLTGIKQINLENVNNIFKNNKFSRKISHWTNVEIKNAISNSCIKEGVLLKLQDPTYRSQRCSNCGIVLKSNRKGKIYECKFCGLNIDADLNAAKNHEQNLSILPFDLRRLKLNNKGFLWTSLGLFNLDGSKLKVSNTQKK